MGTEIERKFLVVNDSFLTPRTNIHRIRLLAQGYPKLNSCSLRFQLVSGPTMPDVGRICVKSHKIDISRAEFEYDIPATDAEALLHRFCDGYRLSKYRVDVKHGDHIWEVDVYLGELKGLMICEVELEDENEAVAQPPWLGPEVTYDSAYYNQNLAQHGWPASFPDLTDCDWTNLAGGCLVHINKWWNHSLAECRV